MLQKTRRLFDGAGPSAYPKGESSYAHPPVLVSKIGLQPLLHMRKKLLN
jgi:hypothetical protein